MVSSRGESTRQGIARPTKKFRPNYIPPVITKYAVPPNVQNNHGSHQQYGGLPYQQPAPIQYQAVHGQPTPVSAHSSGYQQYSHWHEANQHQPHQTPQSQYNNDVSPQPQYQYHGSPPNSQYGQHYAGPVSAEGLPQPCEFYPHDAVMQPQGPPNGTFPNVLPNVAETPFPTARSFSESSSGMVPRRSYSQMISIHSPTGTTRPQSTALHSEEAKEDNMALLDIPDIPEDVNYYGKQRV